MELKKGQTVGFFSLREEIGNGGFGSIWKVKSTEDDKYYAMKIEPLQAKRATLAFEIGVLKRLANSERFPKYVFDGSDETKRFLVEELLGPNLFKITEHLPGQYFEDCYIAKLADEMLYCIEAVHKHGYVHRDIKPQNFVVRLNGNVAICLLDFGISKLYLNQNGQHIEARGHPSGGGSPVYASVNSHNQVDLSRRDDLISLIYSILSISKYRLPWMSTQGIQEIGNIKKQHKLSVLCKPLGPGFVEFANHVESLGFADEPNYQLLHRALAKNIVKNQYLYQWQGIKVQNAQPGGNNDPTGFLLSLMPYMTEAEPESKCNIQ
ncbi:CK1 family protein kinase [Histomonas meleagridis]|uniref:CK1 family protein kinase n=1 Tax=Histomonas meleagridis TaxID=135588 RepID=UPI00355AAE5B|nr:CK1 family protein kinase [Histomonas meleagridis]KAH0796514.1 CK1 family protein kinase [Histomonas meleagridis]